MQVFQWDDKKARENFRDHKIRFEEAATVFDDPHYVIREDYYEFEERWQIIGMADNCVLLLVVHTTRKNSKMEIIRIISARPADHRERRLYVNRNLPKG
jgi:uncharacterized DUF497 family protein